MIALHCVNSVVISVNSSLQLFYYCTVSSISTYSIVKACIYFSCSALLAFLKYHTFVHSVYNKYVGTKEIYHSECML